MEKKTTVAIQVWNTSRELVGSVMLLAEGRRSIQSGTAVIVAEIAEELQQLYQEDYGKLVRNSEDIEVAK